MEGIGVNPSFSNSAHLHDCSVEYNIRNVTTQTASGPVTQYDDQIVRNSQSSKATNFQLTTKVGTR
jgi:hypothetical protein